MKVSVVIPVYNGSRYLAETLDSVLAQTHPLHEIIVVDDGSTDASPEILRSYGDRLGVIRQRNRGVAAARNAGLARVSGDLTAFIDQDDLWPADRTRLLVEALAAAPDAQVAAGQVEIIHERSTLPNLPDQNRTMHREFMVGSLCVRTELFDVLGPFNTGIGYADDTDFLMRRREANVRTVYLDAISLRYRIHASNTSQSQAVTNFHLMGAFRESLKRRRKAANPPDGARRP